MKKQLLSYLFILLSFAVYSQTIIESPRTGFSNTPNLKLTKIVITDSATVLYFITTYTPGNWILIPPKTYIKQDGAGEKLYIKYTDGIPMDKQYFMPPSGKVSYSLIFPPIGKSVKTIDYGEANEGGSWFIYDIRIKPSVALSVIPQNLQGNWFNSSNGNWEVSLLDSVAIYKSQLWKYNSVKIDRNKGYIKLSSHGKETELFVKAGKKGICMIGEDPEKQEKYVNDLSKLSVKDQDKPYELPVFRLDSAMYCGYIKGYTPRIGIKTFNVAVDDIITGQQNSFLGKINEEGFFFVKIPIYYPHNVWVRSSLYNGSVYLEPGKALFQMFDSGNPSQSILFMGESAKLNSDLKKLEKINSFNYYDMKGKILDMKPNDYKAYCQNLQKEDMNKLDALMRTQTVGAKAYQIKKMDINYRYFGNMMEYRWNFESAYRDKNKIPMDQRNLPIQIDSFTVDYFDFLTNENVNNPLGVLSSDYFSFINRLKYLDITPKSISITAIDVVQEMLKSGYMPSEYEKVMFEKLKEIEERPEKKTHWEQIRKASGFLSRYQKEIQSFNKEKKASGWDGIAKYLTEQGFQITENEKQLMKSLSEYDSSDFGKKDRQFYTMYGDSIFKFQSSNSNKVFALIRLRMRNEAIENKLGIKKGFAIEIMDAQDACRGIVAEYTPVSDNEIKSIQKQINTPFISEYIALCNEKMKSKIEANKNKLNYTVNEVPKTEADQLFDSIMKKYKGKVVYVDFWATWCGPCRMGIEEIKPLKVEMADENVVFVYITGPSSPEGTWSNMIPDIKGEHYRVSNDEWNYLCSKFNISGIPHTMIVGKNGEIINPKLGFMSNEAIKAELRKRINE